MADFSGKIDKYDLPIDFKKCRTVCIEQRWECDDAGEYLGGIDENGHERKDNYAPDYETNTVSFAYNKNADILVRRSGIDDETEVSTESALKEIEQHLDSQRDDANRTTAIYNFDGKTQRLDANKLYERAQNVKKSSDFSKRVSAAEAMSVSDISDTTECSFERS